MKTPSELSEYCLDALIYTCRNRRGLNYRNINDTLSGEKQSLTGVMHLNKIMY